MKKNSGIGSFMKIIKMLVVYLHISILSSVSLHADELKEVEE